MNLFFTKMHGIGNDFILIDDREETVAAHTAYGDLSRRLCDRKFGIGADGIIIILKSETLDLKYRMFNPDGSEAEMCGNGMRCFARYVYEKGILDKEEFGVETLAGKIVPKIIKTGDGRAGMVRVNMGRPVLDAEKVPFLSDRKVAVSEEIEVSGRRVEVTAVSMGNPHAVVFVEDIERAPVTELGPEIEIFHRFPEKTNVEFVEVVSEHELHMRVWERGAGVTLACGTGACAAVVASSLNRLAHGEVTVHLLGGDLMIAWNRDDDCVYKTGPAEYVYEGKITI